MFKPFHLRFLVTYTLIGILSACTGAGQVPIDNSTGSLPADTSPPSKPANLNAVGMSASFIQLEWSASVDDVAVVGYRVYSNSVLLETTTQTTYLDTQVTENTEYQYSIVAFDAANNTSASNITITTPMSSTTDTTAPTQPANLRTTASPTSSQISLTWAASTDNIALSGYRIYRDDTLIATTTSTDFTDNGVIAGATYTYVIRAFDAANNTASSNALTVNTPNEIDNTAPSKPTGLMATSSTSSSISLSWNASTDNIGVTHYVIYRDSVQIGSVSNTTFTDTSVQAETLYQYRVAAADAASNISTQSDPLTITSPASTSTTNLPSVLVPISYDCAETNILCVDDTSGPNQEFSTIQDAVDLATAGDTVIVHDGVYAGFTLSNSGNSDTNRIIVSGNGNNVLINSGGSSQGRVLVSNSNYVTIEGFTIENAGSYCLAARDASANNPMVGVTFQFNTVRNCGSTNIYMSHASYSLMLGNTTYGSQSSHGIYLSNAGSDNTIIKGNRSYNNAKNGLHFNGDSSNGGDGLHSNIIIDGNIFYNNTQSGVDADGLYDSVFVNNLIYGNGRHGIRGFRIDASAGVARLSFINNTLVNNGSWGIKLSDDIGGHIFFNNIIMNNAGGCIASGHSNLVSDKNIYSSGCDFSQDGEATTISYTSWSGIYSDSSIESNIGSILSDPGNNDYTLATGSNAIDSGINSLSTANAPNTDIAGNARPGGAAIDIGAFEN